MWISGVTRVLDVLPRNLFAIVLDIATMDLMNGGVVRWLNNVFNDLIR